MNSASFSRAENLLRSSLLGILAAAALPWLLPPTVHGAEAVPIADTPSARALAKMDSSLRRHLDEAFMLAHLTVSEVESCQALFRGLDHPAVLSLKHTLYVPASGAQERRLCGRRVSAFTEVGSRVTYLCRNFGRLPAPRAAATLVHEALHLAGQQEAPIHPGAPSSREINDEVAESCRL